MTLQEFWAIVGGIIALISIVGTVFWKFFDVNTKLENDIECKIKRIYERFDEYKKYVGDTVDSKFVRREMCDILHNDTAKAYTKLELKVDEGFQRLYDKLDKMAHTNLS